MNNITSEELSKFELELNQFNFRDIPVGSLIGSHLNLDFLYGHFNPKDHLREVAMFYYLKFFPGKQIKGFDYRRHEKSKGLPILTFISERRHLFNMSYPIFAELGTDNVFCLIKDERVLALFKTKPKHYALFHEIPTYQYIIWRKEFNDLWHKVRKTIESFIGRNVISPNYSMRLKNNLMGETRRIMSFELLINYIKPKFILTESDRYSYTSPLISVANYLTIPTFTMTHGTINNSIGFTPLVANRVLVWGERQKQAFINYGTDRGQIDITGAPQLSNEVKGDKQELKTRLGIPDNAKIIMLATNPTKTELRIRLFKIFCDALASLPEHQYFGFMKIHPSEDVNFYASLHNTPSNIILDRNKLISFEDSFALADLVCNYNSAFAIDTILRGLPLITINIDNEYLGQAQDFIGNGSLPVVSDSLELKKVIGNYFESGTFSSEVIDKVNLYAKRYCYAFGSEAARNILSIINNDVHKN